MEIIKTIWTCILSFLLVAPSSVGQVQMAVVSDVHVMAPSLLKKDGKAFEDYISQDRKMLRESTSLLNAFTDSILHSSVKFLLIPGDLTKDGELVSHRYLIDNCLSRLKNAGITVLVVPGNHDVNNPHAVEYEGNHKTRVATISRAEFAEMYKDYGYGEAIARDTASLSYVYQLTPRLRILALDATESDQNDYNKDICITPGRLRPATLLFIKQQLADAKKQGMTVIGMMHHGLLQHWKYQNKMIPGYVIENNLKIASMMYDEGLHIMFTGHSHAQDITRYKGVYDVETGSLVSYPSPYRLITLQGDKMNIKTHHINMINGYSGNMSFKEYSKSYETRGFNTFLQKVIPTQMADSVRTQAIDFLSKMMIKNYAGDEKINDAEEAQRIKIEKLIKKNYSFKWSIIFGRVAKAIGNDTEPADNNFSIDIK